MTTWLAPRKELELGKPDVGQKKSPRNGNNWKRRLDSCEQTHKADEQHRYAHNKAGENVDFEKARGAGPENDAENESADAVEACHPAECCYDTCHLVFLSFK